MSDASNVDINLKRSTISNLGLKLQNGKLSGRTFGTAILESPKSIFILLGWWYLIGRFHVMLVDVPQDMPFQVLSNLQLPSCEDSFFIEVL
jgi:hypothetical protein